MLYYERKLKKQGYNLIIGADEVGRGSLAGPVVAAAVSLKKSSFKNRIDDSKKLTPYQREKAFPEILKNCVFGLGIINERVVDRLNVLSATRLAMEQAIKEVVDKIKPRHNNGIHVLIDGNVRLNINYPFTNIIKGDSKSKSIACASILAKVIRDQIMVLYHKAYPQYGFFKHKGYGTRAHLLALKKFGPSAIHRITFCHV